MRTNPNLKIVTSVAATPTMVPRRATGMTLVAAGATRPRQQLVAAPGS